MRDLYKRLLNRELGDEHRYSNVKGIYGDKHWISQLDIVNELGGHSGCVNALNWSRSGRLLASGSDDEHVNIHSYLPGSTCDQFKLATTITTGHRANIFSVKFMPHHNDGMIITAAGDSEVRIFDIEYAGRNPVSRTAQPMRPGRRLGLNTVYNGTTYLSEGDTNAKVFRSHSDRVKRIVTESSPYFFLTCSEDGEVRQWDIRQPESAYPLGSTRMAFGPEPSEVPPPLISYQKYHIYLNTISCSPNQPHYIALGGTHLHCFLHDRRMLGRDRLRERGMPLSPSSSARDEELLGQATQCVRKFAPNGERKMERFNNGHITACKISDANPNEMIVSWSGDWIYSFDLLRSPDASESVQERRNSIKKNNKRTKEAKHSKRKRARISREGTDSPALNEEEELALMVQYGNGQSEQIPLTSRRSSTPPEEAAPQVDLPDQEQRIIFNTAKTVSLIRRKLFVTRNMLTDEEARIKAVNSTLKFASLILTRVDTIMQSWRYPVNPSDTEVSRENRARRTRAAARRFVQASGTLARALGAKLSEDGDVSSTSGQPNPALDQFTHIMPAPNEQNAITQSETFCYDFLKAIILWLDSGVGALLEGFTRPSHLPPNHPRFPVPQDASIEAVEDHLIPYLFRLASDQPIRNVDASKFETDDSLNIFRSETAAVAAFARALKIPFADLSSPEDTQMAEDDDDETSGIHAQDRDTARHFWGFKVGRGLLITAARELPFKRVVQAFGGGKRFDREVKKWETDFVNKFEDVDPQPEPEVTQLQVRRLPVSEESGASDTSRQVVASSSSNSHQPTVEEAPDEDDEGDVSMRESPPATSTASHPTTEGRAELPTSTADEEDEEDEDYDDAGDSDTEADDDVNEDSSDSESDTFHQPFWRSQMNRSAAREEAGAGVPSTSHMRLYRGHCNVKTVKDVNYFGLQDEYVVSGSDSGHIFIWDRKTAQLVNILEGDQEVVNVVQGHPYEPMLAVSGIDHTVKIFSPDGQARRNARLGIGVAPADTSNFSSLGFRLRRRRPPHSPPNDSTPATTSEPAVERSTAADFSEEDDDYIAPEKGFASRQRMNLEYQITSQNDAERRGGQSTERLLTTSMLQQIARHIQAQQHGHPLGGHGSGDGDDDDDEDGDPRQVLLTSDDCSVM